ncbi:MAG: nitroreductase family deazaflavin-dependent oxidoreductase [Myxococcales bacterium]|nr:nitroreductase family deazaflavin-dependent oxidoreductase [Myxococcales bacterium]
MARRIAERPRPNGLLRLFLRLPIWFYRLKLGGLLGHRFLLLKHVGAKTGKPRKTVLEVVAYDAKARTWCLAAGFGTKSHWYNNLRKTPGADIEFGWQKIHVTARFPDNHEGGEIMADYARRHPKAASKLMAFCGFEVDGSEQDCRDVAQLGLPFVVLEERG